MRSWLPWARCTRSWTLERVEWVLSTPTPVVFGLCVLTNACNAMHLGGVRTFWWLDGVAWFAMAFAGWMLVGRAQYEYQRMAMHVEVRIVPGLTPASPEWAPEVMRQLNAHFRPEWGGRELVEPQRVWIDLVPAWDAPLTDEQVQTLVELAQEGQETTFRELCAAWGVVPTSTEFLWQGLRRIGQRARKGGAHGQRARDV